MERNLPRTGIEAIWIRKLRTIESPRRASMSMTCAIDRSKRFANAQSNTSRDEGSPGTTGSARDAMTPERSKKAESERAIRLNSTPILERREEAGQFGTAAEQRAQTETWNPLSGCCK